MVFSSLAFIFVFMPIFFLGYYLLPPNGRNLYIVVSGIIFYIYGTIDKPLYIILFLSSILVNFFIGRAICSSSQSGSIRKKRLLIIGLVFDLGWLFVFKYSPFVFSNLNALWPLSSFKLPAARLVLPLGISFYTFEAASYLIDVYKERLAAEKSLLKLSTYLLMFPQMISGPIVTYRSIAPNINERTVSLEKADSGLKEFTIGLGLKVLLANRIGVLWKDVGTIGYESISSPLAWMGILAFSFQLYFDFYGYSLMALGLGRMMGFELPQNFNYPYISLSMTEFWRRWHMTLGAWFKEYVYIPLGGNRNGIAKTICNMLVVWLLTGIWHGASWNFIIWGIFLFLIMFMEKLGLKKILDKRKLLGHLYMALIIPISWLIFAVHDLSQLKIYFSRLFSFITGSKGINVFAGDYIKYGRSYGLMLIICLIFCTPLPRKVYIKFKDKHLGTLVLLTIFVVSIYCLYKGMNDPFLYFSF